MAMHDVEAGKFGMNFQGIGKEQVRLGFIRLLGFCGRCAFQDFCEGGDGGGWWGHDVYACPRKNKLEKWNDLMICWEMFQGKHLQIVDFFLDLKSKSDGWRLTFLLASRTWTYAWWLVLENSCFFFVKFSWESYLKLPTSTHKQAYNYSGYSPPLSFNKTFLFALIVGWMGTVMIDFTCLMLGGISGFCGSKESENPHSGAPATKFEGKSFCLWNFAVF